MPNLPDTSTDETPKAPPRPVTILCGFLGSGKTTLLNWLLKAPHGLKVAVIVNEFGSVGVDGALVQGGEQFVELDNGCLCCALNEDLDKTIRMLVARGGFDRIVIETTGVADPLPVAWTFSRIGLSQVLRVDAIVTVVDAFALERALKESEECAQQIRRADIIVLNKMDLVDDAGVAARAQVTELNDQAAILPATQAQAPFAFIFDPDNTSHASSAPSDGDAAHALHKGHHHTTFRTYTWQAPKGAILDERRVEDFVYDVPNDIYRFKGLLRTNNDWGPWTLVNAVAGRIDMRPCAPRDEPATSYVVFIGLSLDAVALGAMCDALVIEGSEPAPQSR